MWRIMEKRMETTILGLGFKLLKGRYMRGFIGEYDLGYQGVY